MATLTDAERAAVELREDLCALRVASGDRCAQEDLLHLYAERLRHWAHAGVSDLEWADERWELCKEATLCAACRYDRRLGSFAVFLETCLNRSILVYKTAEAYHKHQTHRRRQGVEDRAVIQRHLASLPRGSAPTPEQIARATKLPLRRVKYALVDEESVSLDAPLGGDDQRPLGETVPDPDTASSDEINVRAMAMNLQRCRRALPKEFVPIFDCRLRRVLEAVRKPRGEAPLPLSLDQAVRELPTYRDFKRPATYKLDLWLREREILSLLRRKGLLSERTSDQTTES